MLALKFVNYCFIIFYIFERVIELSLNQYNKKIMVTKYQAKIKFPKEAWEMRMFHTLWFVSLISETYFRGKIISGVWFLICLLILIFAQGLRWYSIFTLGSNWSVDIYQMKKHPVVVNGPYVFIRHPNYLAVIIEFIFIPLLLGCHFTLILGSIGNAFILKRRIRLEEESLEVESYNSKFYNKKRFVINLF